MTKMRNSAASGREVKRIEKLLRVSGYELYIYKHGIHDKKAPTRFLLSDARSSTAYVV